MKIYSRIEFIAVLLVAIVGVALISESIMPISKLASAKAETSKKIILDAGHGGFDGGAVANDGTVEKDINLAISRSLYCLLKNSGYEVIMTRSSDSSTDDTDSDKISNRKKSDLKNRLKLMNDNPDAVFVSVHLNKFATSTAEGSQVFYGRKNDNSHILSNKIQESIVKLIQHENQRVCKQANSSTYLLYNAEIPAVIVECGFLSNSKELELLKSREYQNKMALCIFCGINDYFKTKEL